MIHDTVEIVLRNKDNEYHSIWFNVFNIISLFPVLELFFAFKGHDFNIVIWERHDLMRITLKLHIFSYEVIMGLEFDNELIPIVIW